MQSNPPIFSQDNQSNDQSNEQPSTPQNDHHPKTPASPGATTILSAAHRRKDRMLVVFIILLALCSVGLACYIAYYQIFANGAETDSAEISTTSSTKANSTETNSTETEPTISGTTPEVSTTAISNEYIYISDWGIKIKKPADYLVSYLYSPIYTNGSISFWAAPSTRQDISSSGYEDPSQNTSSLGTLNRSTTADYNDCHNAMVNDQDYQGVGVCETFGGQKVAEINDYVYIYTGPQDFWSAANSEQAEETAAVEAIKSMLESGLSAI